MCDMVQMVMADALADVSLLEGMIRISNGGQNGFTGFPRSSRVGRKSTDRFSLTLIR